MIASVSILYAYTTVNKYGDNNANFSEGTDWMCGVAECAHTFNLTMAELGEHHKNNYGKPIACPRCDTAPAMRVDRCPVCKNYFPQQREAFRCPHCAEKADRKNQ